MAIESTITASEKPAGATVVIQDGDCGGIAAADIIELSERLRHPETQKQIVAKAWRFLEDKNRPLFAFEKHKMGSDDKVWIVDAPPIGSVWFVGDLHGDLLALEAALHYIAHTCYVKPRIVFLGDLFDDVGFNIETTIRVLEIVTNDPEHYCLLAGNHDEGLLYHEEEKRFDSSVSPSDFAGILNDEKFQTPEMQLLGQMTVKLFGQAPRALFFRDGLLAAHGGFPLRDLWESLKTPVDLNSPECLQDFVWTRAHKTIKRKLPNRTTKGCQFGYEDFDGFCEKASGLLGFTVNKMVRGHDHMDERFEIYEKYAKNRLMTINTLSRRLSREIGGAFERSPCIARYVEGKLPEIHRLRIPVDIIMKVYAPAPEDATTE